MTHTYATLEISELAFKEIEAKLKAAGYDHVFDGNIIDMHGLALIKEQGEPTGLCLECGGYCYDGKQFCCSSHEAATRSYLTSGNL